MNTSFRKYQPAALRVWHWGNALAILGLLATVLLRKTFLSWRTNAAFIESELQGAGTTVTPQVAKAIAVGLRDPMWDWHYVFGFTLVGLLVLRLLIGIAIPTERPGAVAFRAVQAVVASKQPAAAHFAAVRVGYVVFYLSALFMAVSGSVMYFETALGISEDLAHQIKEIHELMMWFFPIFASVHLVGVVVAELRGEPGIVSDMISGGKKD